MPRLDLVGKKFGRLYVKRFAYVKNGRTFWVCVCDCNSDKEIIIMGKYLTNGDTKSCGCLNLEKARQMGLNNKKYNNYYQTDDVIHVKFFNCNDEFLCDVGDWEKAKEICWFKNNTGYARGEINDKFILFHDYILNIDSDCEAEVDHISGNRLDNRKCNLRLCSRKENAYNKGLYSNNTSGVTGVSWHKTYGKWSAYIQKDKINILLGYFDTYEDAVKSRNEAEVKYFGEYSRKAERIS